MKKTALFILLAAFTTGAFAAGNFEGHQKKKKKKAAMAMKAHVCTAACKDGKHMYAHGEKGHVCGTECTKTKM